MTFSLSLFFYTDCLMTLKLIWSLSLSLFGCFFLSHLSVPVSFPSSVPSPHHLLVEWWRLGLISVDSPSTDHSFSPSPTTTQFLWSPEWAMGQQQPHFDHLCENWRLARRGKRPPENVFHFGRSVHLSRAGIQEGNMEQHTNQAGLPSP